MNAQNSNTNNKSQILARAVFFRAVLYPFFYCFNANWGGGTGRWVAKPLWHLSSVGSQWPLQPAADGNLIRNLTVSSKLLCYNNQRARGKNRLDFLIWGFPGKQDFEQFLGHDITGSNTEVFWFSWRRGKSWWENPSTITTTIAAYPTLRATMQINCRHSRGWGSEKEMEKVRQGTETRYRNQTDQWK